jgi:2-dehydropantoate 2-reductase
MFSYVGPELGEKSNKPDPDVNMVTNNPSAMRFLVFGSGAIGTYVGGSLALSGEYVVFNDRPDVANLVRQMGLSIQFPEGGRNIPAPIVAASLEAALADGPFDLAILAIKSFDTKTLLQSILPYKDRIPSILCLQNGVENEALLAEGLGRNEVIPGSVTTAIGRLGPGKIVLERLRGIGISGDNPLVSDLLFVLNKAGLQAKYYRDPVSMKWSKMLTNLFANATSAILDMAPVDIFSHPGLYRLEIRMFQEALRVMAAQKIGVTDLPGTPLNLLVWIIKMLPPGLSQPLLINSLGRGRGAKMPSFHIDLHSGKGKSEVDYLNGAVVRFGEKSGVPTPVNRWLNETLLAMVNGSISKDHYARDPEKLLAAVEKTS